MADPKQAEFDAKLADARANVGSMSSEDLIANYSSYVHGSFGMPTSADPDAMARLAAMIASKENDQPLSEKEQDEDWYQKAGFNGQMAKVFADELKSRGYVTVWPKDGGIPSWKLPQMEGETGHYDDGHAFGWQKPEPPAPPPVNLEGDTGHYDDGHAFGWKAPSVAAASGPMAGVSSRAMLAAGAAALLVVAALIGLAVKGNGSATTTDVPKASATLSAASAAPAGTRAPAAALDPCALITVAEATSFLEKPVTQTLTTPGLQCSYKPQPPATWSFAETSRTAMIRMDSVLITVATGADAQSRYAAKQAIYGKDPTSDDKVSGVGDQAIFTAGTEVSAIAGSRFVNVRTTGDYDWGAGSTRYEDVHQKLISVLSAFAKTALTRMP